MSFHRDFSHGNRNKLDRLRTEPLARPFSSAWPKSWRGSSRVDPVPRQQSPPARSNLAVRRVSEMLDPWDPGSSWFWGVKYGSVSKPCTPGEPQNSW